MLIYNWVPHFTGKHVRGGEEKDFEQAYFFDVDHLPGRRSARGGAGTTVLQGARGRRRGAVSGGTLGSPPPTSMRL